MSDIGLVKKGTTDAEGRFVVGFGPSDFLNPALPLPLLAYRAGYGAEWVDLPYHGEVVAIEIVLSPESLIRGRLMNAEGQPVVGARIVVKGLMAPKANNSLDPFLTAWKQDAGLAPRQTMRMIPAALNTLLHATTDDAGRFVIRGIARERVGQLEISARHLVTSTLWVANRDKFEADSFNKPGTERFVGATPKLVGPDFTHVGIPDFEITGRVMAYDGEPVAGISVMSSNGNDSAVMAQTDADGRYMLSGLRRGQELLINIRPPAESDLLPQTVAMTARAAEAQQTLDVLLKRGIVVSGRVIDPATGRGVLAGIRFSPLPENPFAKQPGYNAFERDATMREVDVDGNFRLVVIPGPGVIMVQAHGERIEIGGQQLSPYRSADFSEGDERSIKVDIRPDRRMFASAYGYESLDIANAVRKVDFPEGSPPQTVKLAVARGKTVDLQFVDAEGQQVANVLIAGITEHWPITAQLADSKCTVFALGSDRPRKVLLLQAERGLAGTVTLTGDEPSPMRVTLGRSAGLRGRAVDETGEPIADAELSISFASATTRELYRFFDLKRPRIATDKAGRFDITPIMPGERYSVSVRIDNQTRSSELKNEQRSLNAGQELDVGDLVFPRNKRTP